MRTTPWLRLVVFAAMLASLSALAGCRAHSAARAAHPAGSGIGSLAADDHDHALGPADAAVVIEAYQEFQCPYCRRSAPTIETLLELYPGQIRYVYRHFPLDFHQMARPAARAAVASAEQGRFWDYHDLMNEAANEGGLDKQDILDTAATLRLDPGAFRAAMNSDAVDARIDADLAAGKALGVTGVPAFFVNGRRLNGAQPVDKFQELIDEELGKAQVKRSQGIPAHLISSVLTQENRASEEP